MELALIGKGPSAGVLVQKLSVQAGAAYTVAAIGTKSTGFSLQVFVDDNRMVVGKATVRVYDLSPRSGTLSVVAGANVLFEPVSYRQASNYQRLAAGPYTFTFSSSQPAFTLVEQVTLKTDMVTSLFLVGMPNGTPPLQVVPMQVKGLPCFGPCVNSRWATKCSSSMLMVRSRFSMSSALKRIRRKMSPCKRSLAIRTAAS